MKVKIFLLFLILSCSITNTACDKKVIPPPEKPVSDYQTKLEVIWTRYFHSDKIGGELFLDPIFWNDYVIISNSSGSHYTKQRGMRVLHKLTGEDHFAWNHEPGGVVDNGHIMECIHIGGTDNNILFTGYIPYLYAIDLNTGQRIWKTTHSPNSGIPKFSMFGNMPLIVYKPSSGGLSTSWCRIAKCDLDTGTKIDLIDIHMEDNYEFLLDPATWTKNEAGDSLILFLYGGWDSKLVQSMIKAYCYNVTKKEMAWEKKDFIENGDVTFEIPTIINNRVVFQAAKSLHCFDVESGDLIWQYVPVPIEGYSSTPMLYRDEKIYIRCGSGVITCLNAQTGTVIWKNIDKKFIPAPSGSMDIYNGKLYFAAWGDNVEFYLYCISAETGELLWQDRGPFGKISGGLIIDQNTGYLYCTNNREIMCIDLNKSPKSE